MLSLSSLVSSFDSFSIQTCLSLTRVGGFGVWMETLPLFEPQDDNEQCSSSATSSIGNDSDLSETVR